MIHRLRNAVILSLVLLAGCRKSAPPYGPSEALKKFQIAPGFKIENFAAEPDVLSPVSMDIDENGRIFVVEDRGYPLSTAEKLGRVVMLEDTNGDGIPDKSTVFADHLTMPTGVMRWKKGILVTDAPDVLYFEDTNGDGRADVRQVVLTGFAVTNPQHTVNNPVYGLDNWIYLAHEGPATAIIFKEQFGDRGSDIRFPSLPAGPAVTAHNRNIRFRPETYQVEALAGSSQFGQAFDDWGHHFTVSNSDHSRHEVIAARYLARNPDLPVPSAMQQISDHGAAAKVFPIVVHPRFELLTEVGTFTSACGLTWWHGSLFVAEPAHSLVHRDLVSGAGPTFLARRDRENVEFLASTDSWFRPVNFYVGPDDALYMMDFYRLIIEHPEWMSSKYHHHHHSPELTMGIDRGRIYRITPASGLPFAKGIRLGSASDQELVRQLANPNIWWRRTAQRLLVDRQAVDAVPDLVRLARDSRSGVGRLHALWTLDGIRKLDAALVGEALADPEPGIRENAILLAEPRLPHAPELRRALLQLAGDPSPRVRFQLLCALGSLKDPQAQAARDRLLSGDAGDKWFQIAALSAGSDDAPRLFARLAAGADTPGRNELVNHVAAVIGSRGRNAEIQQVLRRVMAPGAAAEWRASALVGLGQGLRMRHNASPEVRAALLKLFDTPEPAVRRAALGLLESSGLPEGPAAAAEVSRCARLATDQTSDPALRADAISLLALAGPDSRAGMFRTLIDPKVPEPVAEAAVRAYGTVKGPEVGAFFIKEWRSLTGPERFAAADAMYREPERTRMLVAALKSGDVQPWTLAFRHKRRLIMSDDPEIRAQARALLEQSPADREAVVRRYQPAADGTGSAERGRQVFRDICVKCHRLEGQGAEVGPDLHTVKNQPKQVLLRDILIPSESIAQGYESYVVETVNGTLDGVIGQQTPSTITLRHEDGKEDVVQRKDIRNLYVTNLSAMPGDLEKQIDVRRMTDLLEYLKTVP